MLDSIAEAMHRSSTIWLTALLGIGLVTVIALALFQVRWADQVSRAEGDRMRGNMAFAARGFADDVDRDITTLFGAFRDTEPEPPMLVRRYDQWSRAARDPRLVRAIYVMDRETGDVPLGKLDLDSATLVPVEWPPALREGMAHARRFRRSPLVAEVPALVMPARGPAFGRGAGAPGGPDRPFPPAGEPAPRFGQPPRHIVIIELDRDYLTRTLFPALAKQHFQIDSREIDVAITDGHSLVYRSDADWTPAEKPDVDAPLLEVRGIADEVSPSAWRVMARRHEGALEELVASARRRYLALSFGMLVVLAGSGIVLAVLLRRAERLRVQQLEFVAGVTHELNTPLAALGSAGQNLADGIVSSGDQVKRYGDMIVRESARLAGMVAQVLEFAGMRSGRTVVAREPVHASDVVEQAIENCASFAAQSGVAIEKDVQSDAVIDGERASLVRAVENLLTNAVKYGASGKRVRVHTSSSNGSVAITVEDFGRGVAPHDVPHLFEPFYRGRDSTGMRGSGLGLAIVKEIVEAHGGTVSVDRRRERGAAFAIRLPAGQHA